MNNEQSINDILQMLKLSVEDNTTVKSESKDDNFSKQVLSEEELKQQLKQQYATENEPSVESAEQTYIIDPTLFETEDESDPEETIHIVDAPSAVEIPLVAETETQTFDKTMEEFVEFENDHVAPWEEDSSSVLLKQSQGVDLLEDELVLTETSFSADLSEHVSFFEDLSDEDSIFPEIKTVPLNDLLCDYESEEAPTVEPFSFSESSALSQEISEEEDQMPAFGAEGLHESVFELMSQLGCDDEMDVLNPNFVSEELMAESTYVENKENRLARIQKLRELYQAKKKREGKILLGTLAFAVFIFFYDTIPMLGFEFLGIASHIEYPGAYILLGFQMVLICALFLGRSLLDGAKKLFTLRPNVYSMVTLLLIFTFAYDVIMVLTAHAKFPPMFHFLNAFVMFGTVLGEYVLTLRDIKILSIYTLDQEEYQYTLHKSNGAKSIAEQMYDGGLHRNTNVYVPLSSQEVKGEFQPISEDTMENKWVRFGLLPIALLSILTMIAAILLQNSIEIAAISAMVMIVSALPLHIVFTVCLPLWISAHSLEKRGIAITGKADMDVYADGDLLVYNDLHLFRPCTAKDTGIVFYEKAQSTQVLGCLECLYSTIGGPLKDVFTEIPQEFRMKHIRIRRIFRNGLEAFVDKKHVLLVGDATFMRRYGLSFPASHEVSGRATLCISLDHKITAKMSVRYTTEPVFEMLAERLYQEGIHVVIETFDPMIQAAMIQKIRTLGTAPINVFHKNASYLSQKPTRVIDTDRVGVVANSSRLKLAEAVVWCKRLQSIRRYNGVWTALYALLGCAATFVLLSFGWLSYIHQYWLLLFSALPHITTLITSFSMMPKKNYFTISACQADVCKQPFSTKK